MANFSPSAAEEINIMGRSRTGATEQARSAQRMAKRRKPREASREECLDGSREMKGPGRSWTSVTLFVY